MKAVRVRGQARPRRDKVAKMAVFFFADGRFKGYRLLGNLMISRTLSSEMSISRAISSGWASLPYSCKSWRETRMTC